MGRSKLTSIQYVNLQKHFNELAKIHNYPTLKNIKKVFAVTFKFALRAGYIRDNPVPHIRLPKREHADKVKPDIISNEDFERLIHAVQNLDKYNPWPVEAPFDYQSYAMGLYIGRYTGLRISEVLALQKSDCDLENNCISVNNKVEYIGLKKAEQHLTGRLKSASSKSTIEISKKLSNILKEWFKVNPYELVVCNSKGEIISPATYQVRLKESSRSIGISFRYHMLRHTYATELMMSGINPIIVKDLLRHSEVNTTWNIYTHPQREDQRNALDDLYENEVEESESIQEALEFEMKM